MSETPIEPTVRSTYRTPRWVKIWGIIVLVLVMLFVVLQFVGEGHNPNRHRGMNHGTNTQSTDIPEDHTPPTQHGIQHP